MQEATTANPQKKTEKMNRERLLAQLLLKRSAWRVKNGQNSVEHRGPPRDGDDDKPLAPIGSSFRKEVRNPKAKTLKLLKST